MLYRGNYAFLSNMADLKQNITYDGMSSNNLESLYQASKLLKTTDKKYIAGLNGYEAKREVRKYKIRSDWKNVNIKIMSDLIDIKFNIPLFRRLLLSTLGIELVEDNTWNDTFWGKCNNIGENHLGIIQMAKRHRLSMIAKVKSNIRIGNLYYPHNITYYDYIGFTANNVLNTNNELVMGKGNALTVKTLYPNLPKDLSSLVTENYGIAFVNNIFAFQSKKHYRDNSTLEIINNSLNKLIDHANNNKDKLYALPVPGIENGGLEYDKVLELFINIPNNIHLWKLPRSFKYTGIGSRDISTDKINIVKDIAIRLNTIGFTSRTGDAPGTDMVFKDNSNRLVESYIPWKNFNNSTSELFTQPPIAFTLASFNHPWWDKLKDSVKKLMARNSLQVLGKELDIESDFVIAYTSDGCNHYSTRTNTTGGTGLAISLASKLGIPVYNINNEDDYIKIITMLNSLTK